MVADTDDFCKSSHRKIDIFRERYKTIRFHTDIFLHKAVKATGTELAAPQIILRNDLIVFGRGIGNHDHKSPLLELTGRIINHPSYCFMNQSHGKLFAENVFRTEPLIIALVRIADRQADRMNDHMGGIKGDILKNQFKLTGPDQAIDRS